MLQYLAIIEKAPANFSAFIPDVPGCIATGDTIDETLQNLQEGLVFHFEGMQEDGNELPLPHNLLYHYNSGTFREDRISPNYLIASISVDVQQMAA